MSVQTRRIKALAARHGFIRPRDVELRGIPREYLLRLYRKGTLIRAGRGLYRLPETPVTEYHTLAAVAKRVPRATFCLLSALAIHGLTTQSPHEIWIALARGQRAPRLDSVSTRVMRFSGEALTEGREQRIVEGVRVNIYSAAKTIADCFKYRNKIGLDVAIEALRDGLRKRRVTVRDIDRYAKICRVSRVMRPYLEAIL